jgi:hypothetical protein
MGMNGTLGHGRQWWIQGFLGFGLELTINFHNKHTYEACRNLALALKVEQSTQPAPHIRLAVTADQNAAPPPNELGGSGHGHATFS